MGRHQLSPEWERLQELREAEARIKSPDEPASDTGEILFEQPRGEGQVLRLTRKTFKGKPFLDLRIYFFTDAGGWAPTRKGVSVRMHEADDLGKVIAAEAPARDGGSKERRSTP